MSRLGQVWNATPRFVRNVAVSAPMFLVDLVLLYGLVHYAHTEYLIATVLAFLATNGVSYFLARRLVFRGTRRGVKAGLVYFLAIAGASALALTPFMWLFVSVLHLNVVISRIATSIIVGLAGYAVNLVFNFRLAGRDGADGPAD